ncbi:c6 zinc finger domain containing protein [Grosmannia clavigera kw1407]|uniref:C6 zinc finger domain containing protein n=1 Tax=Grosmannia clavigera (strain kw1407 / UAMH 11150) TaxID=655863 RepID=F0XED0_GROCL|nr:c6 zinc finger domain containing protein [Grosmannia clavigera kw1407]EFX03672.1 c6 zinc finger domain containing protein [Grosmannia clavigera kw1407]
MADRSMEKEKGKPASHNLFQCSACKRTYTRVDHLARHVRSHLHERPFQCPTCNKAFGRLDLLKRHETCHQDDRNSGRTRRSHAGSQSSRVSQACRECAATKLKCDDVKPCGRCRQRGLTCEYVSDGREHLKMLASESPVPVAETSPQRCDPAAATTTAETDKIPLDPSLQDQQPPGGFPDHDMTDFLRDVMTPNLPSLSTKAWLDADAIGPRGLLDFTSDGLELDDSDFGFLDDSCGGEPFSMAAATAMAMVLDPSMESQHSFPPAMLTQLETAVPMTGRGRNVGLGTEAFKRSTLGMWLPALHEGSEAELEHLSVLSAEAGSSPDTTRFNVGAEHRSMHGGVGRAARDGVLAMVLRTCRPERALTVVQTFPPAELLDDLLACFFAHHRQHADSFLHVPTFDVNTQQPELIGALSAFGATLTDARPLHRLGFAIQEAVRRTVPGRCEAANATTRELWLLQAFICELQVGMWSGIKRKMELAESHAPVLYTMLRRAGRFHRLQRPAFEGPLATDSGAVLQRKWRAWVEQESLRRLALHAAIFDAQVSMARLTNPIISYAELAIALPASLALWQAEDAEQWRDQYLREVGEGELGGPGGRAGMEPEGDVDAHPSSLLDFLQHQPAELPAHCDSRFSSLVLLYGVWGLVWQHLQQAATLRHWSASSGGGSGGGQPGALASLRHQELLQTLHHVRLSIGEVARSSEAGLVLELLHMYLHINLGDMQLFAGKEDVEDARRVLPSLQRWWAEGSGARQAVFYAGQVLRVAKAFPARRLCRFYAIAVYHAGLVLWVYGVIWLSQQQQPNGGTGQQQAQPSLMAVQLDGPESATIQRFIAMGKGTPCVGFHFGGNPTAGVVALSDPEAVMDVVVDTLLGNFPTTVRTQEPPPIVQNLVQLLRGLGKAAGEMAA